MEAATYTYDIPANSKLGTSALTSRIQFVPELYFSHFLEGFTHKCRYKAPVFMDIETTGLKIGAADFNIRTIQVGNAYDAYVIPDVDDNIELVYDALIRGTCPIGTQGGVYDWTALMVKYGVADIDPARIIDTKMEAHHWDTRTKDPFTKAPGHSLYALQQLYVHPDVAEDIKKAPTRRAAELKITLEEYFKTVALDDKEYNIYAGMDVATTDLVHRQLDTRLKASAAKGMHNLDVLETDKEDFLNCVLMGARGMAVDRPYFIDLGEQYMKKHDECQQQAAEKFGVTSLFATAKVADAMIAEYEAKHPITENHVYFNASREEQLTGLSQLMGFDHTPTGRLKVGKSFLAEQAAKGSEIAQLVIDGKRAKKWANTFVQGILEASSKHDRVYPKFDPLGARTARYSSSEPNMQNLPGQVSDIRNGFVVDDLENEVVISIDYQSQELRLLAALSQDPQLVSDLVNGLKPPKILAERIYGAGYTEAQYVKTKNTLYGMIYGGGAKTLSEQAGIPIKETKRVMKTFFDMYPGVKEYFDKLITEAGRQGYIRNPAGRLLIVDSERLYSALNYMMQSLGRELIAAAVREIMKSKWRECVRLVVHDEIVLVSRTQHIDDLIREVSAMMDTEINGMHFPVGAEVCGPRWKGHYE